MPAGKSLDVIEEDIFDEDEDEYEDNLKGKKGAKN